MSGEERRFFSGASLAQALMAATRHFHLPPEELAYRQIEKRHGFTHKARAFVIEVDPRSPRREPGESAGVVAARVEPASAAPQATRRPREERGAPARAERPPGRPLRERRSTPGTPRAVATVGEAHLEPVRAAAEALVRLAALDVTVQVRQGREEIRVDLGGSEAAWLAGEGAEALHALEDLLRRMARTAEGETIPVVLDSLGRRSEREGELRSLALAAAAAVRRTGRPVELDPLPPHERRVIHLALAEEPDLVTESRGEDRDRRLEIRPRVPADGPQIP